ncbi:prepilin peptidase [Roseomonas marmotae]|uniref:Prepilin peptidase n=1 Tax=Roseomonas marmotae TaxID=2768161 RepID=A0ABS3KC29_9PROT|nr:A24 family peptidase [Roseomonas marmotae]MBO1075022.1 prepilin peptidase [Roseomonas marmotae]QTI79942.1 prepilin peptidase [Roseomonas marmotae]
MLSISRQNAGRRAIPLLCAMLLAPLAALLPPAAWPAAAVFGALLLALGWIDLRSGLVHAALVLPLVLAGLASAALLGPERLLAATAGAALGYLAFRLIESVFRRLRGHDGLGRGDAWMLGAAGAWVGPGGLAPLVTAAAALALLLVWLRDRRLAQDAEIPFVPALSAAAWVSWILAGGAPSWMPL